MFPISDDNPTSVRPYITWAIIAACGLIFLWQSGLPPAATEVVFLTYGAVPAHIFEPDATATFFMLPELTLISSQYLHGGVMHLLGNMLYLYIFGDNVEAAMGRVRFFIFYTVTGVAAALSHALLVTSSEIPLVGASGAISGVLGAYLILYPHARIRVLFILLPLPIFRIFAIRAVFVLGIWFAIQFVSAALSDADEAGVAFWAHVGGFVAGVALLPFFKKGDVPYWHPAAITQFDGRETEPLEDEDVRDTQKGPWRRISKPRRGPQRGSRRGSQRGSQRGPWGKRR